MKTLLIVLMVFVCFAGAVGTAFGADSINVVVLVPKTLYSGGAGSLTITTVDISDRSPADVHVTARLDSSDSGSLVLFDGRTGIEGHVVVPVDVPVWDSGVYSLVVNAAGMDNPIEADIEVISMPVILIETDKPIYKPTQTIQGRVLLLNNELRPATGEVDVDITDGKGIRIFRETLTANAFGVAPFDLDLADELNFGTWKITAESEYAAGEVDVRVEEYVLPQFDVEIDTGRDYFLVDERVTGTVDATYFFGKQVDGSVEVRASRYVGDWEQYALYTGTLSGGSVDFDLPPVGYVSGTEGAGGAGSATLDVTVTDTSGHEETSSKLLKIVTSHVQLQLIASSPVITPGLPFEVLVVTETPDNDPIDVEADVTVEFGDSPWDFQSEEQQTVTTDGGIAVVSFDAPEDVARATIRCSVEDNGSTSEAELTVFAAYSPSSSFLHIRRAAGEALEIGDMVAFDVFKTNPATVYFDVFAAGRTIFSGATRDDQIVFQTTQQMVPSARLVAYIINPNNEISADTLPFDVSMTGAAGLEAWFSVDETLPGSDVQVGIQADAEAMIGISIVDESVYALNEGRLNMQEVFDELERRFMEPLAEAHPYYGTYGAYDVIEEAGLQILTSIGVTVPRGEDDQWWRWDDAVDFEGDEPEDDGGEPPVLPVGGGAEDGLAEVTRVRQFFPETWLWVPDRLTDTNGGTTFDLEAPDSITTWRLHAVSTSDSGLGIAETELVVFQEFFGEIDLPYAVTRGEDFPVRVQIFNYLDTAQTVRIDLTDSDWFELLDESSLTVTVDANSVAGAWFLIGPTEVGQYTVEVTFRSAERADAVQRELLVQPEGTTRELVQNGILHEGETVALDTVMPEYMVPDSGRILLSVTPSLVAQSMDGVGDLLGMPYGCGEQNMIFLAPDVEILRYLEATDQLIPEIQAEAEHFITVGYQRELTYQREDGSFSAFGDNDEIGSLWLSAFVLGTFSGARDIMTIDQTVLSQAAEWIEGYQLGDGSWEPVGFVHHSEMIGGVEGTYALTAFVALALLDYGNAPSGMFEDAIDYLTANLTTVYDDPYSLAIAALAFARLDSPIAGAATDRLLELAITDENGTHWTPFDIETTAYAALAFMEEDMTTQANDAIKWISLQRNGVGGYNSTQDTVMALKALMTAARLQQRNANLVVTVSETDPDTPGAGAVIEQFSVDESNFDVLQVTDIPIGTSIELSAAGSGEVNFQLVRRFNVLLPETSGGNGMLLDVVYDTSDVAVDDIVTVEVTVGYMGMAQSSGMLLVDVGVPTGFRPVQDSLDALREGGVASRIDVAGRKVIIYIDDLERDGELVFEFQVKAQFPVRAIIPDSKAYSYYAPEIRAEDKGAVIRVELFDKNADDDGDGLPNGWEEAQGLDMDDGLGDNGAMGDPDRDGLNNRREMEVGTRADNPDSDGDYAQDSWELRVGTDPTNEDDSPERVGGDVNGDGKTDVIDIQKTVNQILLLGRNDSDIIADFDGNQRVDAVDLQSVILTVLGL